MKSREKCLCFSVDVSIQRQEGHDGVSDVICRRSLDFYRRSVEKTTPSCEKPMKMAADVGEAEES